MARALGTAKASRCLVILARGRGHYAPIIYNFFLYIYTLIIILTNNFMKTIEDIFYLVHALSAATIAVVV